MNVFYSISILNAKPDEINFVKQITPDAVITTAGDWTRVSWIRPLSIISLTQAAVNMLGKAKTAQLKRKLEEGVPNADMVTLYTQVGDIHDFRVIIR